LATDEEKADEREETGWKLVHADVFRPPVELPMLFCVLAGTGMQLIICAFFLVLFAAVGFLSPANRGELCFIFIDRLTGTCTCVLFYMVFFLSWLFYLFLLSLDECLFGLFM